MSNNKSKLSEERLIYQRKDLLQAQLTNEGISISEQSLIQENSQSSYCCFSNNSNISTTVSYFIPFKNILYTRFADLENDDNEIILTYVKPISDLNQKQNLQIQDINIQILNDISPSQTSLTDYILQKAYPNNFIHPSILILINPHGGQGKAKTIYNEQILPVLKAADVNITYCETEYSEHATDIAKDLDVSKFDIVACCSGDGIPHEVINGFYNKPDMGVEAFNKIAVTQLPCGSGNALSLSTHGSNNASIATWQMLKAKKTKIDLMAVTQEIKNEQVTKLSFLSQCYGMIADSDIGTEHLRWLGPIRFDLGVVHKVYTGAEYPCEVYVKYYTQDKSAIRSHVNEHLRKEISKEHAVTKEDLNTSGPNLSDSIPNDWDKLPNEITSKLNIFYVGKMPYVSSDTQFFPAALPNDGFMDLIITDTNTSKLDQTSILLSVSKGEHINNAKVLHAKITNYRLIPKIDAKNHYISIDGENFPFKPLQVEVLPKILTGLLQDGKFTDTHLTKNI
ncbi:unnamed protein product [Candida verbasci]|uniref:DAGKc domain-containing protein n=1 Tax=Candida verbasci TaxID=1227364 RepID=A0A9W4TSU9_9ASCO|nr:unnamed protein product [Candida verbasci]